MSDWFEEPVRWADVRPGDVVAGRDGRLWMITANLYAANWPELTGTVYAMCGRRSHVTKPDPDALINVLRRS